MPFTVIEVFVDDHYKRQTDQVNASLVGTFETWEEAEKEAHETRFYQLRHQLGDKEIYTESDLGAALLSGECPPYHSGCLAELEQFYLDELWDVLEPEVSPQAGSYVFIL